MAIPRFQGKRVSWRWRAVLRWARREGVNFTLTSGRRTLKEQWALFRQNMMWNGFRWVQRPGRPLTAFPRPGAPHLKRINHALDINTLDGGETRFQRWVESKGVKWRNRVPGEAWHGDVSWRGLTKLYRLAKADAARRALRRG